MPESPGRDELLARARRRDLDRDPKGALEDYSALLALEPGNADWLLERGRLRLTLQDPEGARTDFLAAAPSRPGDARLLYYLALSHAQISPAAALADYRTAATAEPKDAAGFYYRGLTHLALDESKKAHADFAEAARLAFADDPRRELYQEKAAETEPYSLIRAIRTAPATWSLAALNIAIMLAFHELLLDPKVDDLMRRGALERHAVWSGEIWRLLTSEFLHIGLFHLAVNMWSGVVLGSPVEMAIGTWRFLAVYLACAVSASAASLLGHHVVSAGSSGAIFGINGLYLVLLFRKHRKGRPLILNRKIRRELWAIGLCFVAGLVGPFDNWAHAGGLAFGLLFGVLLLPAEGPPFRFRKPACGLVVLLWLGVLGAAVGRTLDPLSRRTYAMFQSVGAADSRGDLPGAEKLLTEALGTGLDEAWIRSSRGSVRQRLGNAQGAQEDYLIVVKTREDGTALWGLASLEATEGRHAEAIPYYDRALRVQSDSPDILAGRGVSLGQLGRKAEAVRDLRQALDTAPADWPYRASMKKHLEDLER